MTGSDRLAINAELNRIALVLIRSGVTMPDAEQWFSGAYLAQVVKACDGNITQASRKAGVHRNTIMNKLRTK